MNATSDTAPSPKRHGWLFKLGIAAGVLVVLVIILYFVATSGAFIKGFILPRVAKSVHADITVSELSLSPWSEVEIKGLKVTPEGREPLLEAQTVRARYSLMDILHGRIVVSEVTLDSPVITLVQKADGSSNLDPLTQKSGAAKPATATATTTASKPVQLDIKNINIKNARFELASTGTNGAKQTIRVSEFNLSIDKLQNGQPTQIKLDSAVLLDQVAGGANALAANLEAKLGGSFEVRLSSALSPESAGGKLRVDVSKATGSMAALAALGVGLDCDWTPTEVRKLGLHLEQSNAPLADLTVSGPFSAQTMEGKLKVALSGVDRKALGLVGASMGIDFNKTTIRSTNEVELRKKGTEIAVNGQFNLDDFSATLLAKKQTTPTLNLGAAYQVTVDRAGKSALIQKLDLNGAANQNNFLKASLSKPMPISWGVGASTPDEAALDLSITSFNLADWQAFASDLAPSGTLDSTVRVISKGGGKQIDLDLTTQLRDFSATISSNQIAHAGMDLVVKAQLAGTGTNAGLNSITLNEYSYKLSLQNKPALSVKGSGSVDTATKTMDLKTTLEGQLAPLLTLVKVPNFSIGSGSLALDSHVVQNAGGRELSLDLTSKVQDLSAQFGSNQIARAGVDLGLKAQLAKTGTNASFNRITLTDYQLTLSQNSQSAVTAKGSADVDVGTKAVNLKAALEAQIPQLLQVVKVPGIDFSSGTFKFDGQVAQGSGGQTVTGTVALTALTGNLNAYKLDRLETKLDTDIQMSNNVALIRKLSGALSHGGKPGGSINLTGSFNTTNKSGQIVAKVADINQNLLQPFVNPALKDKTLASVSINLDTTATVDLAGASTFKGSLGVTNLVVKSAAQTNASPLSVQLAFDTSLKGTTSVDLRQFQIGLTPTSRATNQVNITGQADWSNLKAIAANLNIQADSIDATPYFNMLSSGSTNAAAQTTAAPAAANNTAAVASTEEPDAVNLPVSKVNVGLNINRFYLKQIEITNWLVTTRVETNHIILDPFQLSLNGAPIKSSIDANVGVKGYQYQVVLKVDKLSLEPLILAFAPDKAGTIKGLLIVDTSIKGAGIKDPDLPKNLTGQIGFSLTNAVVQITNSSWLSSLLTPVSTALSVPSLMSDPLNSISCRIAAGQGKATVETFNLKSPAFIADVHGDIVFANPVINSPLDLPMTMSIKKSYVQNVPFFAALAETNSDYVEVPLDVVKVGGTMGKPKAAVNLKLTTKNVTTILKGVESQVGGKDGKAVLGGINSLIGGSTTTNAPSTTNAAPTVNKLLNGLFNKNK